MLTPLARFCWRRSLLRLPQVSIENNLRLRLRLPPMKSQPQPGHSRERSSRGPVSRSIADAPIRATRTLLSTPGRPASDYGRRSHLVAEVDSS